MQQKRSETFDEVADLYDRSRPSYPSELVATIVEEARLEPQARILEIGCGPGKATLPFAQRGYSMLCLEPGRNLATVAANNLRSHPNVRIESVTFEAWPLQPQAFDLVISAQAFHWIAEDVRYVKTAQALKETGSLALFWNLAPDDQGPIMQALDQAYRAHAPTIARAPESDRFRRQVQERTDEIAQSGYFWDLTVKEFPWTQTYTTQQYLDLLNTYSDHRLLPPEHKRALFEAIGAIIDQHGGSIDKPYVAVLYLARKR